MAAKPLTSAARFNLRGAVQPAPRFYCYLGEWQFPNAKKVLRRSVRGAPRESITALEELQLCPMIKQTRNNRVLFGLRSFGISGTGFFICLALLLGPGIAAGQTAQPTAFNPSEPLERYDNPPAYIYRLETGPRMISQFGPFTSFQVNVDANGNNILGDAANESSIAVDPTNGNKITIGWRQFDSVTVQLPAGRLGIYH